MSEIHTLKELKTLVDKQGQALLNAMARISAGDFDASIEIPEGIDVFSNLAFGLTYLAEDMALLVKRQKKYAKQVEALKAKLEEAEKRLEGLPNSESQLEQPEQPPMSAADFIAEDTPYLPSTGRLSPLPGLLDNQVAGVRQTLSIAANEYTTLGQNVGTNGGNGGNGGYHTTLRDNKEILTILGMRETETSPLSPEDFSAIEDVVEQVGLALENQILFDQTQQALMETEMLYQISALLNSAESRDDILKTIATTISDIDGCSLWLLYQDSPDASQWLELNGTWASEEKFPLIPSGSRIELNNYSFLQTLLLESRESTLITNIQEDVRTRYDTNLHAIFQQSNFNSLAFLPLQLSGRLIGMLTLGWRSPREFDMRDQQLFQAIGSQIATTVDSLRLLEETQMRAEQYATIAEIDQSLSTTNDEGSIAQAFAQAFPNSTIVLHYIHYNGEQAESLEIMSAVKDGSVIDYPLMGQVIQLDNLTLSHIWMNRPNEVTHYADIFNDPRMDETTLNLTAKVGDKAFTVLPLYYSGIWMGVVKISWDHPHELSPTERYILENIRETVAGVVANRRSQIAEQRAREETENLYNASQLLNRSANQMTEILRVTSSFVESLYVNKVYILLPELNLGDGPPDLQVADVWADEAAAHTLLPIGARLGSTMGELIGQLENLTLINPVKDTGELQPLNRLLVRLSTKRAALLPLRLGNEPLGYLALCSEEDSNFGQPCVEFLQSIAPQISVAVQNSQLLAVAQARARREELLREITDKVRDGTDLDTVMKTAVSEIGRVLGRKAFLYLKTNDPEEEAG